MIAQLRQWLGNPKRNYDEGVKLYLKLRTDLKFDNFFQSVKNAEPSSLHSNMLVQKLSNILRIEEAKPQPKTAQPEAPKVDISKAKPITVDPIPLKTKKLFPKIDDNPFIRIEELPEDLKALYENEVQPKAKEIAHYHEAAKVANTDEARKEAINMAAELEDKKAAAWKQIDDWWRVNKLGDGKPEEKPAEPEKVNVGKKAIELQARIDDLNTNINRAEKELPTLTDKKKKANREKSLADWKKELKDKSAELKTLIGE